MQNYQQKPEANEQSEKPTQIHMHAAALHASNIYAELYRNAVITVAQEMAKMTSSPGKDVIIGPECIEQAVAAMTCISWLPPDKAKLVQSAWRYIQSTGYSAIHGEPISQGVQEHQPNTAQKEPLNPADKKAQVQQAPPGFPFGSMIKPHPDGPAAQKMKEAAQGGVKVNPMQEMPDSPVPVMSPMDNMEG